MAAIQPRRRGLLRSIGHAILDNPLTQPQKHVRQMYAKRDQAQRVLSQRRVVKVAQRGVIPARRRGVPVRSQLPLDRRRQRLSQQQR